MKVYTDLATRFYTARMKQLLLVSAAAWLTFSCASGHNSSFDNELPIVRDLAAYNKELFTLAESNMNMSVESIGVIEYPGFNTDLFVLTYTPKYDSEKILLITGGCCLYPQPGPGSLGGIFGL